MQAVFRQTFMESDKIVCHRRNESKIAFDCRLKTQNRQ